MNNYYDPISANAFLNNSRAVIQQIQSSFPPIPINTYNVSAVIQENTLLKGELQNVKVFIEQLMSKAKQTPRSFMQDTYTGYRYLIERNGRPVPIGHININRMLIVNPQYDNTYDAVIVDFDTNGSKFTTSIPYKDFVCMNLLPYFKEFIKHPDCQAELVNELLFYLIRSVPNHQFVIITKYTSWIPIGNDMMIFLTKNSYEPHIHKYLSPSIFNREIQYTSQTPYDVASFCCVFEQIHWKLKMLIVF